ncbi:heat-inducible transcriptional repressor HrcA [Corticicoccus populi]|uniref:Heat-inducible transcription repressor HrcA n=1 Tax=Corticicoccus populi TaxID=1812821 RepID=A0ABW5WRU8_9STAP
MLTNRQEIILFHIVDDFLKTMNPVSSKYLIEKYSLDISSATVRNDMAKLEADGFLTKPHTSAGRIPSRQALKYYISILSENLDDSLEEPYRLNYRGVQDPGLISQEIAREISQMTNHLTQVSLTGRNEVVKALYLTPISGHLLLVIVVLDTGDIRKIPVTLPSDVTMEEIEFLGNLLNQAVADQSLALIDTMVNIPHPKASINQLIMDISEALTSVTRPSMVSGHSGFNHLIQQISSDSNTLQMLYDAIETNQLSSIVDLDRLNGVEVYLSDDLEKEYHSISVITTNFKQFGVSGNLMIIGPEIMGYKEVIKLLYAIKNQDVKGSDSRDEQRN